MEINQLKKEFEKFKSNNKYLNRLEQSKFTPLARKIISEALNKEKWNNEVLTALIQIFRPNCSAENFKKYISHLFNETISQKYYDEWVRIGEKGYTTPAKAEIKIEEEDKIIGIKNLFKDAFIVSTQEEGLNLILDYEQKGLATPSFSFYNYSTLLYYIQPQIFPIINGGVLKGLEYLSITSKRKKLYSDYLKPLYNLYNELGIENFGLLDSFVFNSTNQSDKISGINKHRNVKEEFAKWLEINGKESYRKQYYGYTPKSIIEKLDKINSFFDRDLFLVSDPQEQKKYISHVIYKGKSGQLNEEFRIYSDDKSRGIPTAIIGREGYFKFLDSLELQSSNEISLINNNEKNDMPTNHPLNTILYGPPGTGKTYNTVNKAIQIANPDFDLNVERSEVKAEYDRLVKEGQIVFTTFHQNYTYEDFMIGIKPNIGDTGKSLSFKEHKGVFYEIAQKARESYERANRHLSEEDKLQRAIDKLISEVEAEIKSQGFFSIGKNGKIEEVKRDAFIYRKDEKKSPDTILFKDLKQIYLDGFSKRGTRIAEYYIPLLDKIVENLEGAKGIQNYVLIIDEINRANISKVFGELITLLEDDKRLGAENELKATLPNGEEFGVPPNLYVIGTMNTADKSIALIDIALRRRFHFEGKYPDSNNIDNSDKKKFLEDINKAVYDKKKSADWLIGHAYFMKRESLNTIIENKIIPLLMEYFGNKTELVQEILGATNFPYTFNTTTFVWQLISE